MSALKDFLEKEKQLLHSATPGRWELYLKHEDPDFPSTIAFSQIAAYSKETKLHVIMCRLGVPDKICMKKADAAFIANVRTSHAKALEIIDVMREALNFIDIAAQAQRDNNTKVEDLYAGFREIQMLVQKFGFARAEEILK